MKNRNGFTLIEIIIVIGIMAVILGIAAGPFMDLFKKGKLEDRASTLHETFKSAQMEAMKLGDSDIINGQIIKQRIYIFVNASTNVYRVARWKDNNADSVKDNNEFTLLQEGSLMESRFGTLASVGKKACGNTNGAPAGSVVNFNSNICPAGISMFDGFRCARFDGKGFLSESMENAALYITNNIDNYAIALNPAGVMTLCRWDGTGWQFVR